MALTDLKDTLNTAMTSIRESVHDLHDDSIDLYVEINELISHFTKCPVQYEYNLSSELERKEKYSILAIIKEALTNITKHSNATSVRLILQEHPALFQILIHDNGTKLPAVETPGLGLQNIQERVDNMNGNLRISTDSGFRIFISIPKKNTQNEGDTQ